MLSRLAESDIWPAFLGQVEIHPCRCNVDQTVAVIQCQVVMCLALKVAEHLRIIAIDPSRGSDVDGLEQTLDLVFIAQAVRNNLELKRADRAKDQVVIASRLEQLRRTFLT